MSTRVLGKSATSCAIDCVQLPWKLRAVFNRPRSRVWYTNDRSSVGAPKERGWNRDPIIIYCRQLCLIITFNLPILLHILYRILYIIQDYTGIYIFLFYLYAFIFHIFIMFFFVCILIMIRNNFLFAVNLKSSFYLLNKIVKKIFISVNVPFGQQKINVEFRECARKVQQ